MLNIPGQKLTHVYFPIDAIVSLVYTMEDGALGAGRKVRCAACGHSWFAGADGQLIGDGKMYVFTTRAATISPPSTGPSSRAMPMATMLGTTDSALKRAPPE